MNNKFSLLSFSTLCLNILNFDWANIIFFALSLTIRGDSCPRRVIISCGLCCCRCSQKCDNFRVMDRVLVGPFDIAVSRFCRRKVGGRARTMDNGLGTGALFFLLLLSRASRYLASPRILAYRDYNPKTIRGKGTSFRRNNFWDRLGGQALLMIG